MKTTITKTAIIIWLNTAEPKPERIKPKTKVDELEKELIDFILWLTPCGEVSEPPTHETIGKEAGKLFKKIQQHQLRNKCK